MRPLRFATMAAAALTASATALVVSAGPAAAHTHPTPVELIAPAVVRVETYAEVNISLIEHGLRGAHIGLLQQTYTPMLAVGSGFAVDPSGGVVTSPKVINVDLRRAEIFAVNQIFNKRYGARAPLPADPYATHRIVGGDPADRIAERLQQCYRPNTTGDSGGCVVFSQRRVRVLPFVTSQQEFGNLDATVQQTRQADVVVLKVGASSMPAARLATTVRGAPFAVLGFTTTPSDAQSLSKLEGHFIKDGSIELKRDEWYPALVAGLGKGIVGGPVVGERGEVIGFLVRQPGSSASSDLAMIDASKIRAALSEATIAPHSGPTDSAYERALHNYNNKLYKASLPDLQQTVKLYPGHALATVALAQATRKQGTAEDLTGRATATAAQPTSVDFWRTVLPLGIAGVALIALVVAIVLLLLRRRRRRAGGAAPAPEQPTASTVSTAPSAVPRPREASTPGEVPPAWTDAGTTRRQATVLKPSRPVVAGTYGTPSAAQETAAACAVCGSLAAEGQTFCAQCGQRLK
jgi:hypothetical protein